MEKEKINSGNLSSIVLFLAFLVLAYYARYALITSIIGLGLGVLFFSPVRMLTYKIHLPKAVSILVLITGLFLLSFIVAGSLYYVLSDQVSSLSLKAPMITQTVNEWFISLFEKYPWIKDRVHDLNFSNTLKDSLSSIFKGFQAGIKVFSSFILAVVIGLYAAIDGNRLFSSLIEAFPPNSRQKAKSVLIDCAQALRVWFKSQLIDILIIGILTAIGLWISGVEYWAIFGLLTAIFGVIPYVGIFIVVIIASIITLGTAPAKVPWVLGVFLITQQLEGHLILPLVMKGKANLPVVPLLILMLLLGTLFGIVGIFLAPPFLAIAKVLYIDLYLEKWQQ
jgi:predicted PurR-regulated permease PerM